MKISKLLGIRGTPSINRLSNLGEVKPSDKTTSDLQVDSSYHLAISEGDIQVKSLDSKNSYPLHRNLILGVALATTLTPSLVSAGVSSAGLQFANATQVLSNTSIAKTSTSSRLRVNEQEAVRFETPFQTFNHLVRAIKNSDVKALKQAIHPDGLKYGEKVAKEKGVTSDYLFSKTIDMLKGVKIKQAEKPYYSTDNVKAFQVTLKKFIFSKKLYAIYVKTPDRGWLLYDLSDKRTNGIPEKPFSYPLKVAESMIEGNELEEF